MIKEVKNGFCLDKVSHRNFETNINHMRLSALAYNLVNSFKRLVLPKKFEGFQVGTLRNKFFKIGSKMIKGGGQVTYKMASAYPFKTAFFEIHENIGVLAALTTENRVLVCVRMTS